MSWKCFFFHKWEIKKIARTLQNYSTIYYACSRCGEDKTTQIQGKWTIDKNGNLLKVGKKKELK